MVVNECECERSEDVDEDEDNHCPVGVSFLFGEDKVG